MPLQVKQQIEMKSYAVFDSTAGTNPPTYGFGIASVTRTGVGTYTVNFVNSMANTNYAIMCTANNGSVGSPTGTKTTSSFNVQFFSITGTLQDLSGNTIMVFA